MYYFSENSIKEISKIVDDIMVLFSLPIQSRLSSFVSEISRNKCCEPTDYSYILSLLQKDTEKKPIHNENADSAAEENKDKREKKALGQLEYLIMILTAKAFISRNDDRCVSINKVLEVKK